MSRESILFSMKKFYRDFYRNDMWNDELAEQFMALKNKKNMRIQIIRSIYDCIERLEKAESELKKCAQ